MKNLSIFICLFVFLFAGVVFADGAMEAPDFTSSLLQVLDLVKEKAAIIPLLVAVFQLLKTAPVTSIIGKLSGKYQQLIVAIVTTGGYVVHALASGQSTFSAVVEGLLTSGGAMLMYDAFRSIKKSEAQA
jgi:hypothetical protein